MSKRITTDQIGELVAQDKAGRVTRDDLDAFLKNPSRWRDAEIVVNTAPAGTKTENGFTFKVDYGLTVVQMIAAGRYGWANDDVTWDNFPHDRTLNKIKITAELIHFGRNMSTDAVLAELDRRGLRPATMAELLAFGASFPEEQRKLPIVELGSIWTLRCGYRLVGYLHGYGSERFLNLYDVEGGWYDRYRFLAVRK